MPVLDMPMEELKDYKGSSPCPEDIDVFWNNAIDEMKAIDPQIELVPADFKVPSAECFDLYFTGVGGSRVHAKYLRPANISKAVPAVLQFHGYTASSGEWNDKLSYINCGFAVAALDCRGQGGYSENIETVKGNTHNGHIIRGLQETSPEKLLFRQIFLDTAQLAGIVMAFDEIDDARVCAIGSSQGGALTVACAALEPRIYKAAPGCPFLSDYKRVWDMDLDADAYAELRTFFRFYDPTHEHENEIFERLGYIDIQNIAKRIKSEILWSIGMLDNICPPSSQFAVYNKITAPKQMMIYPDFAHEGYPGFGDKAMQFFLDN